jgi:hypothetical protein
MFGFSSGDLMTLDDERHLFVSVVSGWLRRAGGMPEHDAGCIPADFV